MRYTEKEYENEYNGLKGWLSVLAALIIVAPLRLLNEISTKIVYLNRKLIQKILNLAAVIAGICTIADIILNYVLTDVSLWIGKVPIILQVICTLILVGISIWFSLYDFAIYKHLSALLPITTKSNYDGEENKDIQDSEKASKQDKTDFDTESMSNFSAVKPKTFSNLEDDIFTELENLELPDMEPVVPTMDITELSDRLAATDYVTEDNATATEEIKSTIDPSIVTGSSVETDIASSMNVSSLNALDDELFELLNEDLLDDETTNTFRHEISDKIEDLQVVSDEELEKQMDASTDPSKYITEDSLFKYLKELGADNFGEFDMFGDYAPSDDFDLYS